MAPSIRNEKRKNRSPRMLITGMGCLLATGMLILGIFAGILMGVVALPDVLGFTGTQAYLGTLRADIDETAIALAGLDIALANTRSANNVRATQQALNAAATLAYLTNQQGLIDQTATRTTRDIIATRTSAAVENARQGTQIALDYEATQSQLQQNATQVELDYRQTQTSLGNQTEDLDIEAQANAVNVASSPSPTQTPIATQTALLPPSHTPTASPSPRLLDDDFSQGLSSSWLSASANDWLAQDNRLRALRDGAWLLRNEQFATPYRLYIGVTPTLASNATYAIIIAGRSDTTTQDETGYVLVYQSQGLQVNEVALYSWQYTDALVWDLTGGQLLANEIIEGLLIGNTTFVVTIQGDELIAELNGNEVLTYRLDDVAIGTVGVVLPGGASLNQITLTRLDS